MSKTELPITLDDEVAKDVIEAAKTAEVSVSEWVSDAVERSLATERGLLGVDDLEEELEEDLAEVSPEIEAEFGDTVLATP